MSAKPAKKSANKASTPTATATPAAAAALPPMAGAGGVATMDSAEAPPAWLDSSDPKKRLWGKIIFTGVWIYVGALWLLALDQTFSWGIFGPKVPPLP